MQERFGLITSLSDRTIDNTTAITSIALGASIIEKHVTLDRNGGGPDDSFSLEPKELMQLCESAKIAYDSLGKVDYGHKSSEQGSIKFRRSLYFVQDIEKGDVITKGHIRRIRPGFGLLPKFEKEIIGKVAKQDIKSGTATSWELINR